MSSAQPIGYFADTDCDGTSISYHDTEHPAWDGRFPYGEAAHGYMSREEFEAKVMPHMSPREKAYWAKAGYWGDHSGIRNCEIARPVTPVTARYL